MKILITGGCGFIGSHLVEYCLKHNHEVVAIDDLSTGSLKNIAAFQNNSAFHFENADILSWPNLQKYVAWADRIYHMAAIIGVYRVLENAITVLNTNITGTEKLLEAIKNSNHRPQVIIPSSSSVYGHNENTFLNETTDLVIKSSAHPLSYYALSKIAQESFALAYWHTEKIPVIIIRLFNIIGPRQTGRYGMVVPTFVQQACTEKPITIFGDGTQTRSFCDVRDFLAALNLLVNNPKSVGEIVNMGFDKEISINELGELVRKRAKSNSSIKYIPYEEAYGESLTDIKQRHPDISKLLQLTNYQHQWTLEQTIDDLIKRFRATQP